MLAVDTNVIIRYLTNDHPQQSLRARRVIDAQDVWVPTTVVLETEWVLRSVYRYTARQTAAALRQFAGLPSVTLENAGLAARALDWVEHGIDFADALRLGAAAHCEAFVTFDIALAKAAKQVGGTDLRAP